MHLYSSCISYQEEAKEPLNIRKMVHINLINLDVNANNDVFTISRYNNK